MITAGTLNLTGGNYAFAQEEEGKNHYSFNNLEIVNPPEDTFGFIINPGFEHLVIEDMNGD